MKTFFLVIMIFCSVESLTKEIDIQCENSVYVDASNKLDLLAVLKKQSFQKIKSNKLTFGFSPDRHWLKVSCYNPSMEKKLVRYQFLYPVVKILNIYTKEIDSPTHKLGFEPPPEGALIQGNVLPDFSFTISPKQVFQFYVEAKSEGSLQLQARLILDKENVLNVTTSTFLYGIFFGALLSLMLYNIFLGFSLKDKTYLLYGGYLFFFFLFQLSLTGYAPILFGKTGYSITEGRGVFLYLCLICISLFTKNFLLLKYRSPIFNKLIIYIVIALTAIVVSSPFISQQTLLQFSAFISIIVPTFLLVVSSLIWRSGFIPAKYFVTAWVMFFVAIIVTAMRNIGLVPKIWLTDHILEMGILTEVFLISLGLAFKVRLLEIDKNKALSEAATERQKAIYLDAKGEKDKVLSKLTAQVSHDIRSPLSALNLILTDLDSFPENKRILIRTAVTRISDIANSLLLKSKAPTLVKAPHGENQVLLASLVASLISEKRIQCRENLELTIDLKLQEAYGLFVRIDSVELKRVLSNLINNSIEALIGQSGNITVEIKPKSKHIELKVSDNGKGIPIHVIQSLGKEGVTFGKEGTTSGFGLGLFHAKKTVEDSGGSLKIESKNNNGAEISLSLIKVTPPEWFLDSLMVSQQQAVVAVDDDHSILEVWKQKFENPLCSKLILLSSGASLKKWISDNEGMSKDAIYLIDYEFLNQNQNGLDLISELNICSSSTLVTSRFDEYSIQERCMTKGIKLVPKDMVDLLDIKFYS